ncbi:type II toxin-antitoxin system RelE/ParE family toxin [Photobacterium chitinilyticum]|uniref:Type II toxin-antitoxin system RelE/ParE family toxin n=1 Tax=Photobacterium chitinilyticum TaxID=2485123 RepID=A0A3S3SZ68_9GAMM|nr:type II toxin-antitoxin system RelE/ParE family toxin [Photobacterium chitinilyticum]RWX55358.1 type II toxin-antitoxin system RelE/ParE family toxin [Photobacterium chitinilyticum]
MTKLVKIEYTETFVKSVEQNIDYLSAYKPESMVIDDIESLVTFFEESVTQFPEMFKICHDLTLLGDYRFREVVKDGFRLLYSIEHVSDDEGIITGEVLVRTKNSLQEQLFNHCLLHR